jgi:hypothetical protein
MSATATSASSIHFQQVQAQRVVELHVLSRETLITTTRTTILLLHFLTVIAVTNALLPVSGTWLRNCSDELALETLFLFMLECTGVLFLL